MRALCIFVKYPKPGFVKTRLAKDIGNRKAASLYKNFVQQTLKQTLSKEYQSIIFYSPQNKKKEFINWLGKTKKYYLQKGKDLGQKMQNAFKIAFDKGFKEVIIIGTDSPSINEKRILGAFSKLKKNQCVIGPCFDGGYYLIGLNELSEEIFKNIVWSTSEVFEQTLKNLKKEKFKIGLLKKERDIDTVEDLKKTPPRWQRR